MSTPEFNKQFNLNMDTIAKFGGYRNVKYDLDITIPDLKGRTVIASCGHIVTEHECSVNGGWCKRCAQYGEIE